MAAESVGYSGINAAATSHYIPQSRSGAIYRANKGVTLIIVVFAMMVLGVLGWTLSNMQATDFQINAGGNLDSERALYLAEAGAQYALTQLSLNGCWRTGGDCSSVDSDCNDNPDWLSAHTISPGQYRVCCRQPVPLVEDGDAVIVSRGYVPQAVEPYRAMRQIKIKVELGSLTNVLQTQVPDPDDQTIGLFNWSKSNNQPPVVPLHNVQIEGAIEAGHYEADNDGTPDELGQDYDPPPGALLPDDTTNPPNDPRTFSTSFPSINMSNFYALTPAANRWPSSNEQTAPIIATISTAGNNQYADVVPAGFFTGMAGEVFRRNAATDWWLTDGQGNSDWKVIQNVSNGGRRARIANQMLDWVNWDTLDENPIAPLPQITIKLVRRIDSDALADGLYYTGRTEEVGGSAADMLIDVRDPPLGPGDLNGFLNNHFICEGNIVIKGDNGLRMRFNPPTTIYPMLATKYGNIISLDQPDDNSEANRANQRQIAGLIYSEFGEVRFNYLRNPSQGGGGANYRRNLVYGKQITLDGRIRLRYGPAVSPSGGFVFKPSLLDWDEE